MKKLLLIISIIVGTAGHAVADDRAANVDAIVTGALGPQTDAEKYCRNIADLAKQAKFEWQVKTIDELEGALAVRIADLEKKSAEVQEWLEKREAFMRMAEDNLVGIYAKMRPDAAASQIELLQPTIAAALLLKLNPRIAGQVLNEMPAKHAALLSRIMIEAGTAAPDDKA